MMTYDLHGIWDKGNIWLGAYLDGHTNLTEIIPALDLLWRNNIDPSKVNLGLAFYARTFTMSDPSCSAPGCMFDSAGTAGPCTQSVGTLSNAEIADVIQKYSLTPIHYTDAAVKVITWEGDQWVAYDDGDTYQQKIDFARSECLGGVMVWAISEDSAAVASSLSLPDATRVDLGGIFLQGKFLKLNVSFTR
jgi:chitinase